MQRQLPGWLFGCMLLLAGPVQADMQLAIVISQQSPVNTLDQRALQAVFLGLLTQDPQLRELKPVDLTDGAERDFFYQQLVGRNRNQMQAYWSRMSFTGRGQAPPALQLELLQRELDADPHRIAYVPKQWVHDKVKVLMFIP